MEHFIFGNLTWSALPHEWFTIGGTVSIILGMALVGGVITYYKRWRWLWRDWLTSTDPKKIGVMYIVVASVMLFRGGLDAIMIWIQQAMSVGNSQGYLDPSHFQQIFTAHGDIMVFFVTMGFLFGLMNLIVPLEIGARDLAFPFLNSLGFWLYVAGAVLINTFFAVGGQFASAGWLSLPPLSELAYSPGTGVDYWIWSLQISGLGSLLGGLNFLVTIIKMRAPGMTLMKMPMFVWTSLCSSALILSAFPMLTVTTGLLWLDRFFGMHFFTSGFGGNPMMYVNLIWMWGHPEVYILVIPSFGIFSEVVSTFSGKKIIWLCLHGLRRDFDHGARRLGLAASFFHDGCGRRRERVLWHFDDAHRHSSRRANVQLDSHDVARAHPLYDADVLVYGICEHVHVWRHGRRLARDAGCGLSIA